MLYDKINRIKYLVTKLNECRDSYYNKSESPITDKEYDDMFNELQVLEKDTEIVFCNSPTHSVGYPVKSKLEKVNHDIPLLSLDKTKKVNDLVAFMGENPCLLMHKFDGLTVELIYNRGILVQASTRGDGYVGEDITHNARTFKNIPLEIPYTGFLRLAGEAIIYRDDFNAINDNLPSGEKPYANARNLASGSVRLLNSEECASRNINWMLWDVLEGLDDSGWSSDSRISKFIVCKSLGFEIPMVYSFDSIDDVHNIDHSIDVFKHNASVLGIPIDGLVMKYDSYSYSKKKGSTSHHNNDGIAFKFQNEEVETTLRLIEWSMGRTGQLTPVAIFDPVELDGTIVSRASVHNLSYMKDLDLNVGDKISIYKANEIIPQIKENLSLKERENPIGIKYQNYCPCCGHQTKVVQTNDTETLYCANYHCSGKRLSAFEHFVSKPAMNIEGISSSTLWKFIEKGWLDTFPDIYHLDEHKYEIIEMPGFGVRSYEKMWDAIQKSRKVSFDKFLVSLGIPTIGKTASKTIAKYCNYILDKFEYLISNDFDWTLLDDFGQVMSDSITDWFYDPMNVVIFAQLLDCVEFQKPETTETQNNEFAGKTVVVTGSLQSFTRESITAKLEELGAKVSNSISKKTDFLICGEKAGSKLDKAQQLGTIILTEKQFLDKIS